MFIPAVRAREAFPGALADVLWNFCDAGGPVDIAKAERAFGAELGQFLRKLAAIDGRAATRPFGDRLVYEFLTDYQRERVLGSTPSCAPPLPAVDFALKRFGKPHELDGFRFLGLQHLFASTGTMFKALETLGVAPKDSHVIGKIYSTNVRVAAELSLKGMDVDATSYNIHTNKFANAMSSSIEQQLRHLIETLPKPKRYDADGNELKHVVWDTPPKPQILLIDDGAEAIKMLNEKYPDYAPFFACVEQTRRGARIAHELADKGQLKCAVVNVAESWAKLEQESPMIGESVVREVVRKLDRLDQSGVPRAREATVIGYGAVGKRVAEALKERGLTVHIYDSDPERLKDLPAGMVGHANKDEALGHGQVTISCVGARTLFNDDYEKLPQGAVLVNAASADDELGPETLLRMEKRHTVVDKRGELWGVFQGQALNLGKAGDSAHTDAVVKLESGKELLVASSGFVVNMTGERDTIPPAFIQLTRSLLLMGAMTAVRANKPGLVDVPMGWQKEVVGFIERQLAAEGKSLQKPLWDAVVDVPVAPPKTILEEVELERHGIEREERIPEMDEAVERIHMTPPKITPPNADALRGLYTLGPANDPNTYAYSVASAMNVPRRDMTMETWALYHASLYANYVNGWHLTAKFVPNEEGRPTAAQLAGPNASPEQVFQAFSGYHLAGLAFAALQLRLKRPPTDAELADAVVKTAGPAKVDLSLYAAWLKKQGPEELAFAKLLEAGPAKVSAA